MSDHDRLVKLTKDYNIEHSGTIDGLCQALGKKFGVRITDYRFPDERLSMTLAAVEGVIKRDGVSPTMVKKSVSAPKKSAPGKGSLPKGTSTPDTVPPQETAAVKKPNPFEKKSDKKDEKMPKKPKKKKG